MPDISTQNKDKKFKSKEETLLFFKKFIEKNIEHCRKVAEIYVQNPALKNIESELKDAFYFRLNARLNYFIELYLSFLLNPDLDKDVKSVYYLGDSSNVLIQIANDELKDIS